MSVNLKKGGRLSLTKERPGLNRVIVVLDGIQLKREVSLVSKKLRLIVMQVQSCVVMVNTVTLMI